MQIEPEASKDEAFLERLKNARTILLICVYQGIAFSALRGIIDAGITDDDLPLTTSHIQGLKCYGVDEHKLRQFVKCQRHFKPARLDGNGSKLFRSEETIIPYTEWKDIGSGTFSSVYKVTLKAREHDIYGDQVEEGDELKLALKVRIENGNFLEEEWRREDTIFQKLRHHHIVQLVASYTLDFSTTPRHRHMLLPLAECNLKSVMRNSPSPSFTLLLEQLVGLTDALCLVHSHEDRESDRSLTGYHHDVKPTNILLFKVAGSDFGVLRLADWGCAKLHHQLRNGSSCGTNGSYIGDTDYAAPETGRYDAKLSRPYDSWSIGCVILEMVVWNFLGTQGVMDFEEARRRNINPGSVAENFAFWTKDKDNTTCLRRGVVDYKGKIARHDRCTTMTSKILGLVERLLCLEPRERLKMAELKEELAKILRQAQEEPETVLR
ncbi:MAG: hypothetical protein MMC33_008708 [Icmadophila ericetorum]|nr:hypothetical protein [Icmadophila ericetorum]